MARKPHDVDYGAVFQAAPDRYMLLDRDLNILAVSDAYARATMIRNEDVAGRPLFEVFPDNPDDPAATGVGNLRTSLVRVLATKAPDAMAVQKYDIRKPGDGEFEERYWSPVNTPVLTAAGEVLYILHRAEDVTDYLRLQEEGARQGAAAQELMSRNAVIERDIVRRAHEVQAANKRLEEANAEIARADAQKSFFFAAASHDIRQPLHAAMSYLSVLREELGGEQAALCAKAEQALDMAAGVLTRFLDVALFDEGLVEPKPRDFALGPFLERLQIQAAKEAGARGASVRIAAQPVFVHSDPVLLESIVGNFIFNALRHSGAERVELGYETRGDCERITVTDTGKGIPEAEREHVFEDFVQLENPERDRRRGHGLGLAIAKRVARALGARIGVDSEPGRGATFWVEAPRAKEAPAQGVQSSPRPDMAARAILLIEDDDLIADAMLLSLDLEGIGARRAGSVAEVVEIIAAGFSPDALICDFRLPDGDGAGAIAKARAALGATIPAVILTGEAQLERLGVSLERCAILTKPAPIETILKALTQAMR